MDRNEFAERVMALRPRLYAAAKMYLGSEAMAQDALGEAIYKGLRGCRKLRQPEFFATWMTRIVLNECAGELRKSRRTVDMGELPETAVEQFDALPLRDAVLRLPRELKDVVILRYFSGLTLRETAQALDIPQGTAATREKRALKLLRLEFIEEGNENGQEK